MSKAKIEKVAPAKVVEEVAATGKAQFDSLLKQGTEAAEKAMAAAKERMEKGVASYGEVSAFSKQSVEALVSASTVTAKGVESLNAEIMAFAKTQMEGSMAAGKALTTAKTLQELMDLQGEYAKAAFDGYMGQVTKIGELAAKIAKEAFEPINAQIQAAVEKMAKPLAA